MKIPGIHEIESLMQHRQWPAVSLYLPVSRIGDQKDAIRYKNFLAKVEKKLGDGGMRTPDIRGMLEGELFRIKDGEYWKNLGADGLAVFISENFTQHYSLPVSFNEIVQVSNRFHIKPLIPLLDSGCYLVIAVSKSSVRLFEGDRFHFEELELPEGTPASMAEALRFDDPEKQLQYHTKTATPGGNPRGAIFHGQGGAGDEENSNLERYFQLVDRHLFPGLDEKNCPIVLAGSDELLAVYLQLSRSKRILEQGFIKNVSDLSVDDLHARTWELAETFFAKGEKEAVNILQNNLGTGKVIEDLQSVLIAAYEGRVETLFVVKDERIWGVFNPEKLQVTVTDENDAKNVDLLDEAVFWTLAKKGKIYIKDPDTMPCETVICAHLRY